ncbi:hypothetical protein HPB49_007620 [Dermacentor silvarum]|uniref:Uncharacterized protein n=1 Tax=Dermacentor silvarum TaxID=543639 RepID=A0ACB8DBK9_DERSI|nr:hypothetical protein HPB49_007620 [Dermacentor silvarum]
METYQAENTNRFACIERTLQPIVSHPTFEPLFAQNPPNQKTPYTPTQSWPPTQQQQQHQAKQAVIQRYIAHVTSKPDVILPQERLTDAPSLPGGGTSASPMAEACCVDRHHEDGSERQKLRSGASGGEDSPTPAPEAESSGGGTTDRYPDRIVTEPGTDVSHVDQDIPDRQVKGLPERDGRSHAHLVGMHQTPRGSKIKNDSAAAQGSREEHYQDQQLWAIQQVLGAPERQGPSEPATASRDPRCVMATP